MALSVDLRERVLAAHERREGSQRVLAERFAVSLGTVNAWLRLARAGQRAPRKGAMATPCSAAPILRSCATSWPGRTTRPFRNTRRSWPSGRADDASTRAR